MEKVSFEEFKERDGNPMTGVAANNAIYYAGEEEMAVLLDYEDHDGIDARVLRPSSYFDGQFRTDESKNFVGRNAKEQAEEWIHDR